ncbi:nuclear pore complex protein Nup205 isoform X2 [Lycorma delicatula]|uniref:nuclear pore complex protein Nup205 isoform X2 n=1 Tax=Lycorma delicatula TaxID=130591 RepID=UPI003F517060
MEGNVNEDMWTPFKELLAVVEGAVSRPVDTVLEQLEKYLQKHKQNFFTLLKNPPKNAKSREDLQKGVTEGISLPGIGHQTLPQELVDEALIISDMYDLNEYLALDLLCTAHHQIPYYIGLTRGLIAVLLYYDGKRALVTALRILVQARQGVLWSVDCHPDVSNYITNFTNELLADGIISKILNILESLDLSKEMQILEVNRALGGPRHHHQVVDLYQGIRQTLADIVFLWAAQSGLPKQPTLELIALLRRTKIQEDSSGGIDSVTLALEMALLYAVDISILHKRQDGEELAEKLPLLEQAGFVSSLLAELSNTSKTWECSGLQALTQLAWGVSLATLRMAPPSLQCQAFIDEDDLLVDAAVDAKVFNFLNSNFLLNENIYKEEFYLRRMHCLLTDFIALMPLKVKELRNRADEAAKTVQVYVQEGLDPPANLPHHFEHLLLTLATLYSKDPLNLNLELEFWYPPEGLPTSYPYRTPPRQVPLFKFVRQSGDLLPPTLFVPYMKMLSSLSSCQLAARQCFNLLKMNSLNTVTWDHFFNSFARYYSNLRQELPPTSDTVYRHRSYSKGITPQEIQALLAVLGVIKTVAEYDDVSRLALCENPAWAPLTVLLGLVSCCIQITLKAELLLTLAALAKSPDSAATLWHNLEASQILVTVPSTSSYQPRGIQTELEELESRNEEFPLTRAMLRLLDVLTDVPVPRLLGVGSRMPGFDPYLTFILQSVLLRFNNRSYKNPQEKWEVCKSCMQLLVKLLGQYEPQGEDFIGGQVQMQGGATAQVNPPPGYHIMVNLCSKSELLRMVLYVIDEGCHLLDTYSLFPGKSMLQASTSSSLQLLDTALGLQQRFLMTLNNVGCSLLLTPLNKLLLGINPRTGKPDHLLNIAKYVTYNNWLPNHALLSVRILLAVTSYPTPQCHILSVFTSTPQLKTHIRHGFVECLEADPDEVIGSETEEEDVGVVGRTKESICKLLLQCLNHAQPNLAHYLLGFELNKDVKHTIFQQPGVLGFPRTCLHSILSLLNSSLQARSNPTYQPPHPRLVELCYRLIFSLTANVRTSEPTLRFLRSGEFLQKHLVALPFKSENKGSNLNQMSWLLKTVAIELKVTAAHQQLSQFTSLVNLLVSVGADNEVGVESELPTTAPVLASQLTSTFTSITNASINPLNQQLILRLLREFEFFVEPVPQPTWEFFDGQQIQQVIRQCETSVGSGLRLIDIKMLHKILMEELAAIQGSSTANQRQLIMQEIQLILKYALKQNLQRNMAASTTHFLDAWRQVTEVMFAVALSDSLQFETRFCLLLEILHELLNKVLANNILSEMANLSSGAILLLFVDLRNCFTLEQSKVASGGIESINRLNALVHSRENVLKNIMSSIIKWILSSGVSSQKIRANLYASLLNFLHLTRQQNPLIAQTPETDQSMYSLLYDQKDVTDEEGNLLLGSRNSSLEVLAGFGERLVTVICHDCSGGHDVCKMLALSCLDMMIELDPHGTWITFLSARGYLKFLIDSLLESDQQLRELLSPVLKTLRPLYVYESKMALLCRVASTAIGSELLLEQNALSCLSAMQVFDTHPDITANVNKRITHLSELDFIPSVSSRYLQILSPALSLCETVLSSLGVENESAVVQVIHFLLSHGDTFSMVLRSGSPFLPLCYLNELAQLTGVIARATNQSVRKKVAEESEDAAAMLESTSHFHRIQKLMLTLLGQFVISDSVLKDVANSADIERNKPQKRGEAINCFLQITANLVLYARNLVVSTGVDRRVTSVVLHPTLLDPLLAERKDVGLSGEASLGVIVQQLVQCVKHYHSEKDTLDFLTQHLNSVADMNTVSVKEFLPEELSNYSALDECRQQAGQVLQARIAEKMKELQLYIFIIEHCLYLLWSHLDYYMLRAIPNRTLGIEKTAKPKGKTTQMAEITWGVSVDEINQLKQGLISVLNDSFCKNLINTTQEQTSTEKGFIEALLRRIKKLIQFVPDK